MSKNRLIVAILVAALAILSVVFFVLNKPAGNANLDNRASIATNLPMSGPLAVYGSSIREGVEFYLSRNNDATNRLTFDWQDNASDPTIAVRIASRQLEGTSSLPDVYISGVKPQTMAVSPIVNSSRIPHFAWIFDPVIRASGPRNFRTWVSYKIEPEVYFDFIENHNASKVAIAYVELPHTVEEFEKIVIPSLKQKGIQYTTEVFEFGRTDFREIASKLVNSDADVIILNGFQLELAALVRALRQEPNYDASKVIGTYDMLDAAEILSAEEIEGISVVTPVFSTDKGRENNSAWIDSFKDKYNSAPLYTHAFAHDMAYILDHVSQNLSTNADSDAWVQEISNTKLNGITGAVEFDTDGDLITPLVIGVFRSGEVVASSN